MTGAKGGIEQIAQARIENQKAPDQKVDEIDVPRREDIRLVDWLALPDSPPAP